jgi:hypothetical protein
MGQARLGGRALFPALKFRVALGKLTTLAAAVFRERSQADDRFRSHPPSAERKIAVIP